VRRRGLHWAQQEKTPSASIPCSIILHAQWATPQQHRGEVAFRTARIELGLLTVMIMVLVVSLFILRKRHPDAIATRA
jgi:hypothetical protein